MELNAATSKTGLVFSFWVNYSFKVLKLKVKAFIHIMLA